MEGKQGAGSKGQMFGQKCTGKTKIKKNKVLNKDAKVSGDLLFYLFNHRKQLLCSPNYETFKIPK